MLSFNAAPYYEPNLATGKFETAPNQGSGTTVVVTVNGDGTFDDGTQTQTLRNRTPIETGADAKGYMEYTLHTLRVTGATGRDDLYDRYVARRNGSRNGIELLPDVVRRFAHRAGIGPEKSEKSSRPIVGRLLFDKGRS